MHQDRALANTGTDDGALALADTANADANAANADADATDTVADTVALAGTDEAG